MTYSTTKALLFRTGCDLVVTCLVKCLILLVGLSVSSCFNHLDIGYQPYFRLNQDIIGFLSDKLSLFRKKCLILTLENRLSPCNNSYFPN
jgi:hypothetical protein